MPSKTSISGSSAAAKYCDIGQDSNSSLSEGLSSPEPQKEQKKESEKYNSYC